MSIGSLPLPAAGRVASYAVHTSADNRRALPVSFDQARHVGAGSRPGSWMAVAVTLPHPADHEVLAEAWLRVIARHGTLRSAFTVGDDGHPLLHEIDVLPGSWVDHPAVPGQAPAAVVQSVLDVTCSPYERPSHRLLVVEADGEQVVIVGADHAHVDAWSMLVLVRDLTTFLTDLGVDGLEAGTGPHLAGTTLLPVPAFADHTADLAAQPPAPEEVHREWADILTRSGGVMPRFPLPLGDVSGPRPDVVEVIDILDARELAAYAERAASLGVRMLPLTVAVMTRVTRALTEQPLRVVMPVHSRSEATWKDAVGWFITNSVLESDSPDPQACAEAVRRTIRLGSYPLAPIMAPYGGMPTAPGMFALSWLDNRRLPVTLPPGLSPRQLSASMPTDGVMVWLLLNDDGMHVRCRYPDTPEARLSMELWLTSVHDGIRAEVRSVEKVLVG